MLIGPQKSLGDEQSRMNDSTRGQWDWYASHRRQIERLIVPEARGGRICVLGAGNCNDLDLKWLVEAYAEVHLVDIDPSALERAAGRQAVAGHARLRLHAPVDLTGIAGLTAGWRGRAVNHAEAEAAIRATSTNFETATSIGANFDVVLSPCVLSQLLCGVRDMLGKGHDVWPALKSAIRSRHLKTVTQLLKPSGRGVLIVDLASSKRLPGLDRAKEADLAALMRMSVNEGKGFRGLEPAELESLLRRDGVTTSISAPWLWHLGWGKAFLCYGMTIRRGL
ncbi:MAG: hypothetical protein JWN40_2602 [Phycisphaerales bacterium]|nr:hypothetical protein [Phycisphaerales bacterium]